MNSRIWMSLLLSSSCILFSAFAQADGEGIAICKISTTKEASLSYKTGPDSRHFMNSLAGVQLASEFKVDASNSEITFSNIRHVIYVRAEKNIVTIDPQVWVTDCLPFDNSCPNKNQISYQKLQIEKYDISEIHKLEKTYFDGNMKVECADAETLFNTK